MQDDSAFLTDFAAWLQESDACRNPHAMALARLAILDTVGCMIAGSQEPQVRQVAEAMTAAGGTGRCPSVAGRDSFSLPAAAMINGTAVHIQDLDDYETSASTHPGAPILGALSAFIHSADYTLNQVLEAYIAGYEMIVRTGLAVGGYAHYMAGWHATSTIGPLGAAAAGAKLLDLNTDMTANALSMAASMSAGLKAQFGTDTKALHAGLAARAGVESVLLAQSGLSANQTPLVGEYAYLARYGGEPPLPSTPMTGQMVGLITCPILRKPWPSCAYTHRSIEAAMALYGRVDSIASKIANGFIRIPEPYFRVVPFNHPSSPAEARFSLTWCVASALVDGSVSADSFSGTALTRRTVRNTLSRLSVDAYTPPAGLSDMSPHAPDTVTLRMANGEEISESIGHVKGGEANPLSDADVRQKFRACGGADSIADRITNGPLDQPFRFLG